MPVFTPEVTERSVETEIVTRPTIANLPPAGTAMRATGNGASLDFHIPSHRRGIPDDDDKGFYVILDGPGPETYRSHRFWLDSGWTFEVLS